nr:hypothetical protein Iba_chr14aCG14170 [Ipomoea batatas]
MPCKGEASSYAPEEEYEYEWDLQDSKMLAQSWKFQEWANKKRALIGTNDFAGCLRSGPLDNFTKDRDISNPRASDILSGQSSYGRKDTSWSVFHGNFLSIKLLFFANMNNASLLCRYPQARLCGESPPPNQWNGFLFEAIIEKRHESKEFPSCSTNAHWLSTSKFLEIMNALEPYTSTFTAQEC